MPIGSRVSSRCDFLNNCRQSGIALALLAAFALVSVAPGTALKAQSTNPRLTAPAYGSTISGTTVNFTWGPGSSTVQRYQFRVSAAEQGAGELYNTGTTLATNATVNNLPTNGGPVYVRLYYEVKGVWSYADYTFMALNAVNVTSFGNPVTTDSAQAAMNSAAANGEALYFPCGTYTLGSLNLRSNIHILGAGTCSEIQQASPYGFDEFVGSDLSNVEIDHLNFIGNPSATGPPFSNEAIYIASSTPAIGNNTNINIHENTFQNWPSTATYIWYTNGLYFRNNQCIYNKSCIQAYDNEHVWVEQNSVSGVNAPPGTPTSEIGIQSVSGLPPLGGHPTYPGLHNQDIHVNNNTILNHVFGEDILIHDAIGGEVKGNSSQNYDAAISITAAANFNGVLDGITIQSNTGNGGDQTDPTEDGSFGVDVGGDTASAKSPVWVSATTYTLPANNTCTTSPLTCVVPTTAATQAQRAIRFILSAASSGNTCTSGNTEPPWPAGLDGIGFTIADGTCTWTSLGPWKATSITVTGNTFTHNGFQEKNIDGVNYAFYASGATDGVQFTNNAASGCYGACFGIINTANNVVMQGNSATNVVKNTSWNMRRGLYIPNGTVATGTLSQNYVNDADYGYFWAQTVGNLSGMSAQGNTVGADIAVAPIYRGGTCSLNPNTGTTCP